LLGGGDQGATAGAGKLVSSEMDITTTGKKPFLLSTFECLESVWYLLLQKVGRERGGGKVNR
jgi:hypothetical protein